MNGAVQINPKDFASLRALKVPCILLDVREPTEVALASIAGYVNIPLNLLPREFAQFSPNDKIITLCHHGIRSLKACLFLREQGYRDVLSLAGGIDAWAKEVDPTMPLY